MNRLHLTLSASCLALATSCASGPERIDPHSDEAVTSMGVDYSELVEWADTLTRRMLDSGFLDSGAFGEQPITMVVSDVENKTDLSQFPKEVVLARIRSAMLGSGKARFTTVYGDDAIDRMTRETQDKWEDPLFDATQIPEGGQAAVARLSVRTQILWVHAQAGSSRQNTYEVRMWVTDVASGTAVWEGLSDPIAKKFTRSKVGW
ncbi:MAG: hypothetical protein QF903_00660 [Planctomycetota bacterium]|jgi:hypothetical protein|nr:hypothetical protein [Planctomycetota bacterium]MDP6763293.1 hypothetical protein [Planctomycetota bacterium]MDP6987971.1 hypothetical protein [Planctomycetota bacterium]